MSCYSIWLPGRYQNARGQHGAGGIEVVHFPTLLAGVPNDPSTQIIAVAGDDVRSNYAKTLVRRYIHDAAQAHCPRATTRTVFGFADAWINRQGQVIKAY